MSRFLHVDSRGLVTGRARIGRRAAGVRFGAFFSASGEETIGNGAVFNAVLLKVLHSRALFGLVGSATTLDILKID